MKSSTCAGLAASGEAEPATGPEGLSPRAILVIAFATVYLVWGSTYLAIRFVLETLPPFLSAGARQLVAGGLLAGWAVWRERPAFPTASQWKGAAIVGVCLLMGGNGLVVWAQQRVPSGVASLLVGISPFWMVLLGWLAFGERRPGAVTWAGLVMGFAGLVVLVAPWRAHPAVTAGVVAGAVRQGADFVDPVGALVILAATVSWTSGSLYSRRADRPPSKALNIGMQMLCGGVALVAAGLLTGETARVHFDAVSLKSALAWLYLVFGGSIIGFSAYIYLLSATSPALASTYGFVNPVVAVFLGWALAGESVGPRTLAAGGLIVAAVAAISWDGAKKPPAEAIEPERD